MPKTRKGMGSKTFVKKVKEIVQKELKDELEEKTAVLGAQTISFNTAVPSGNVQTSPNIIRMFPNILQSNSQKQYNGRVGNEIRLKNLNLKMLLQFSAPATQVTNESQLGVRVMILRQKDKNSHIDAVTDFQGDKLLENGEIVSPGPSSFTGDTINLFQKINRDQFAVRYDKTFYIARERQENRGAGEPVQNERNYIAPPTKPTFINKTLTFGKKGLKLTFGDSASQSPTNFPYFMVVGYASTLQSTPVSDDLVEYTYTANAQYTDA